MPLKLPPEGRNEWPIGALVDVAIFSGKKWPYFSERASLDYELLKELATKAANKIW